MCPGLLRHGGGVTEVYRVGLDDLSFFNRVMQAGGRIAPRPEPA